MKARACPRPRSVREANGHVRAAAPSHLRGFTMVELMVSIAIAAILAGLAVPSFRDLIASNRLKSHTSAFHTSLLLARSEAIKRKEGRVVVCKSADGAACTTDGGWQQGWIVFADANGNGSVNAGEVVFHKVASLSGDFLLKRESGHDTLADYVSYSSTGAPKLTGSENPQSGAFTLCQAGVAGDARQLEIFVTGRVSVSKVPVTSCTAS
jgi:type IV fimbrial biogenesis protein FimT